MLPGAVSYKLFTIWTGNIDKYDYRSFINIFMFSIVNYLLPELVPFSIQYIQHILYDLPIISRPNPLLTLLSEDVNVNFQSIFFATLTGVFTAIFASYMETSNVIPLLGQKFKVTTTTGRNTTRENFFRNTNQWLTIRDHSLNLTYVGYISEFSIGEPPLVELLIKDVSVYDDDSNPLYETDEILLIRNVSELTIEVNTRR